MKKNKTFFPKAVLKSFVKDIKDLVGANEGRMHILEMIEDIPFELRSSLFQDLGSFYEPYLVDFFYLIKLEYGKEFDSICSRVLEKYSMAGIDTSPHQVFQGVFAGAYASTTRHSGRIAIDVAWAANKNKVHTECFYLTFNADGIHSFFLIEDMDQRRYEAERGLLMDMVPLKFEEVCFLVSQAYAYNIRHMSKPAAGRYLYNKYLNQNITLSERLQYNLICKLSSKLTPRQLVNSIFYAVRNQDLDYVLAMLPPQGLMVKSLFTSIIQVPDKMLVEGGVSSVRGTSDKALVQAYTVTIEAHQIMRSEYKVDLVRNKYGYWHIDNIRTVFNKKIGVDSSDDYFDEKIVCWVYDIIDLDLLFDAIDKIENIRVVKELPYGMHMRITFHEEDFNTPVSLLSEVLADIIINGEEFVLISRDRKVILGFDSLISGGKNYPVVKNGEYEINLLNTIRYLGGQYLHFEDILLQEEEDSAFEDGMRLVCTRYLLKNRERIIQQINSMENIVYRFENEYEVFYQLEPGAGGGECFLAEYIVGANWATLSTFGDQDMSLARKDFEDKVHEFLEFDGLEVRREGIFDILNTGLKRQRPELEEFLKEIYLNKWLHSRSAILHGMSPSEACKTEEGNRLLWLMFKKIKEKGNRRHISGNPNYIHLNEYIKKLEQKKQHNI